MPDSNFSSKNSVWPYVIAAVVSLIGLGDAIYLTVQDITGQNLRCTVITGCAEVLGSKYAHIGPIPLAAVGAVAYFAVFGLAILMIFGYSFVRPLLQILVAIMFLTTLWLLYLQAFVIRHFCQYCLLSAAMTIIIVAVLLFTAIAQRRSAAA